AEAGVSAAEDRAAERRLRSQASAARDSAADAERARREDEQRRAEMTRDLLGAATVGGSFVAGGAVEERIDLSEEYERAAEKAAELAAAQKELLDIAATSADSFATGWTDSIEQVREAWEEANRAAQAAGTQMISRGRLMERSLVAVGNNIAET